MLIENTYKKSSKLYEINFIEKDYILLYNFGNECIFFAI